MRQLRIDSSFYLPEFLHDCKSTTYAGIGSRKTPQDVCLLMTHIARFLGSKGWTLRSGGAIRADQAFEDGARRKEIFRPNHRLPEEAFTIAARYHPKWSDLPDYEKRLHARNTLQILGSRCDDPSAFVLCWTPDGSVGKTTAKTGGTGQALRIAHAYNVPIFNLRLPEHRKAWEDFLK